MCKLLFSVVVIFLFSCKGEKKQPEERSALPERVISFYSKQQYDSIFYLFSKEMKDQLSLDDTKKFFSRLQEDAGDADSMKMISRNGSTARYRVDFQNSTLWMDITQNRYGRIDGLLFTPYDGPLADKPVIRNQTRMILPFAGEWFVFWGGDTRDQNYHVISRSQRHAFDLVIADSTGKRFRFDGRKNEDYYAFGQLLFAPCDATVVAVTDGVKDNTPGVMNPEQVTGNSVVLQAGPNEFVLLAHFKMNSIRVKRGDTVKEGDALGLCGNSGNSSEPHLHLHLQDKEIMDGASGIKCYFEKIIVNGKPRTSYSRIKGERIKN